MRSALYGDCAARTRTEMVGCLVVRVFSMRTVPADIGYPEQGSVGGLGPHRPRQVPE